MKTFFSIIINRKPPAMYDSYEDSTHGPPDGPSRVHLEKKGIAGSFRKPRHNAPALSQRPGLVSLSLWPSYIVTLLGQG